MAILFARSKNLEQSWPFVPEALLEQLNEIDEVQIVNVERGQPIGEAADLSNVSAIAMFSGQLTDVCLKTAPKLKVVAVSGEEAIATWRWIRCLNAILP